jgi:hypothetical protein
MNSRNQAWDIGNAFIYSTHGGHPNVGSKHSLVYRGICVGHWFGCADAGSSAGSNRHPGASAILRGGHCAKRTAAAAG